MPGYFRNGKPNETSQAEMEHEACVTVHSKTVPPSKDVNAQIDEQNGHAKMIDRLMNESLSCESHSWCQ